MATEEKTNHAESNARGWLATIRSMAAALECDFDRLEELRDEREAITDEIEEYAHADDEDDAKQSDIDRLVDARRSLMEWDTENAEELAELIAAATIDGEEFKDADAVRERIKESPLSVLVRDGWKGPGAESDGPEEFEILLSTGGPALRIRGDLDQHCQPTRAYMQWQDWGTPWTDYYESGMADALLAFASVFYYGE